MTKQENLEGEKAEDAGYDEIEDPDFFKFEDIGDSVEGTLIDVGTSDQYGFGLYTIEKADETQIRFHGSSILDARMKQVNIGDYVRIKYMDVEKRPKGDMKLFSVKRRN